MYLLPLLSETSVSGVHLGLSVCLSGRLTQKLLLRLTSFFTHQIIYPWLGPPLRLSGSGLKNLLNDSFPLGDTTKYAIKLCHNVKRPL